MTMSTALAFMAGSLSCRLLMGFFEVSPKPIGVTEASVAAAVVVLLLVGSVLFGPTRFGRR